MKADDFCDETAQEESAFLQAFLTCEQYHKQNYPVRRIDMEALDQTGVVYCIVDLICAVILFYCTATVRKVTDKSSIAKYVFMTYLFAAFGAVLDISYGVREYHIFFISQASSYVWTILCVVSPILSALAWLLYSQKKQSGCLTQSGRCLTFIIYIYAFMLALIITTPFTHLYFYFDDHHYYRGPIFIPVSVLSYVFCLISGIRALIKSFDKNHYIDRMELRRLFGYSVSIVIVQTLQLVLPHALPTRTIGTMLILLFWLVQNLKEMLGRDGLTHLKNRFAAEELLDKKIRSEEVFGVIGLDIDKFKSVNDTYGHNEGDKAIKYVATALKDTLRKDYFVSRMGGDEFLAIGGKSMEELTQIEEKINTKIGLLLEEEKKKYRITVSAGCVLWNKSINNVPDLLEKTDMILYERKKEKRNSYDRK